MLDKTQLDTLLKGKWNSMKTALMNQDVEGAVAPFLSSSQERYRDIFSAIADQLPSIAANMKAIEMIYAEKGVAQYRTKRTEDVGEDILPFFEVAEVLDDVKGVCRAADDDKFISCAVASSADYIVSGDNSLCEVGKYKAVRIIRAFELLKMFN